MALSTNKFLPPPITFILKHPRTWPIGGLRTYFTYISVTLLKLRNATGEMLAILLCPRRLERQQKKKTGDREISRYPSAIPASYIGEPHEKPVKLISELSILLPFHQQHCGWQNRTAWKMLFIEVSPKGDILFY